MPLPNILTPELAATYEQLKKVRESKTVSLKPTPMLRSEIVGFNGKLQPFKLRYYQAQGIYHLLLMKRLILGDATGLGKTAELLGALCYLWPNEPNNRVIVVTPKSALRQWDSEIHRFTTGIKTYIVSGSLEERRKVYEAWAKHPENALTKPVLLVNYHLLVRDWDFGGGLKKDPNNPKDKGVMVRGLVNGLTHEMKGITVAFDECFDYHTPIKLANGTSALIGRVVSKKLPVEVFSWNFDTQQVEAKKVVAWHKKPLRLGRSETMLKVTSRFSGTVNVTRSHNFYRMNGEALRAFTLRPGIEIATLVQNAPSAHQEQVILGALLGDSSLSHPTRDLWGVCFGHSRKQEVYLRFKRDLLASLGVSDVSFYQTEYQSGDQQMARFRLDSNAYLTSVLEGCGIRFDDRKTPTVALLDRIDSLGLAIWYGDDGSIQKYSNGSVSYITLNTQGFTKQENELLAGWLRWKWGIKAKVTTQTNKKRGAKYYTLYLDRLAAEKFLALMPGALPGVEYKFPGKVPLCLSDLDLKSRRTVVKDSVISVDPWLPVVNPKLKTRYVYDLEVEDNHNYFANGALVSNCTAFKNSSTKTWQVAFQLSQRAHRVYGLTATLLKNNLMEGFSIYKAIVPDLFSTKTAFIADFCVTRMMPVGKGRQIPLVVGYRNLQVFRDRIDPFFLGRLKHVVSDELPTLITKEIVCELSSAEDAKYSEALSGVLELGDGVVKDYEEHKAFVSLIYCQQAVNSLAMLKFSAGQEIETGMFHDEVLEVDKLGAKEQTLLDLITDELGDEKVIVYTRFASLVPRLQHILAEAKIKSVRITGKDNDKARKHSQDTFQNLESDTKVIFITDAGSEAINLQAASAMVFYDAPWSWGSYVQLLGRSIRIGSPHQHLVCYHLIAERPRESRKDRKTIDHHVLAMIDKKKGLIDKVLGEAAVGALDFEKGSSTKDLVRKLQGKDKDEE
jgi:hypothetical protein